MRRAPEKSPSFGAKEREEAEWLIQRALREDFVDQDLTSLALFSGGVAAAESGAATARDVRVRARCVAKEGGVVCGLPVVELLYATWDPRVVVTAQRTDGDRVAPGDAVASVEGPACSVLAGERAALNFLGRLSGIASTTSRWVKELADVSAQILDTRKTTPGWRYLEKYAVRTGGGTNHRFHLADGALVKDNHVWILRAMGGSGLRDWVAALRAQAPDAFLEVEVDSRQEFIDARQTVVDAILLDNFSIDDLTWAVKTNRELGGRPPLLEASGGVRLDRLAAIASTGVDRISAGALTHSTRSLDVSLECYGIARTEKIVEKE